MIDNSKEYAIYDRKFDGVVMLNKFKICEVEGCCEPVRAKNMCKSHRQRFLEYGRLNKIVDGTKVSHPLYDIWNSRKRYFVKEWLNFDSFINDVGEKPTDCFLATLDLSKPCGPNNFEWRRIKLRVLKGETSAQYSSRHSKLARETDPDYARKLNYRYNYGITLEEVEQKLAAQNYVCAICEKEETAKYKNTDKIKSLALDHCHKTGKIRDFLCSSCNLFLGKFEDKLAIIDKFYTYLEKHSNG